MAFIDTFDFDITSISDIRKLKHKGAKVGENWPVVYLLNSENEAYVGETVNVATRTKQHLANPAKQQLTEIRIISDDDYNKSVILDLEAYLIKHISGEGKYKLLNENHGIQDHDYYERSRYEGEFRKIWNQLRKKGVVEKTIEEIENSALYKYSPYKSLGTEQIEAEHEILSVLAEYNMSGQGVTIVVNGSAGTGKTILAVYLMKLFSDINSRGIVDPEEDDYLEEDSEFAFASDSIQGIQKIGIVFPQTTLRTSMKEVFGSISSLSPDMVLDTTDVVKNYFADKKKYDLLIVDEAHRLKSRKNHGNMFNNKAFNETCRALGLDPAIDSELDWIMMCSRNQILFRDDKQRVRACDMDDEQFYSIVHDKYGTVPVRQYLFTQWRCQGGKDYIDYLKSIFAGTAKKKLQIENYDFKLFDDVNDMVNAIKALNKDMGLCRNAAGYAWEWKTKPGNKKYKGKKGLYDIVIGDYKYRWNSTYDNWIISNNATNEIGCIHTVQGYDLNYLGVIIGEDIKYDCENNCIVADINNYYDTLGRTGLTDKPEALRDYLINIYITLMTRGIHGTYVYVCDDALREYMAQFIDRA